jgi:LPS-assembly lipoprotein
MSKRLILLFLSLTLISSCGFKLRGNFEMPAALSEISVETDDRLLKEELTTRLQKSGSMVVATKAGIPTLSVLTSDYERIVRTTDSDGLATGYDFTYKIVYRVDDGSGGILQPQAKIVQRRTLQYDPAEQLQAKQEEEFLVEEMREEIVLQVMRKLSTI